MNPTQVFATGAFDAMLKGTRTVKVDRIGAIKMVRQITGSDLRTVKNAFDDRMEVLGIDYRALYTN